MRLSMVRMLKFMTLALSVAMVASCNKADDTLMATIPANATFVAVVNGERLLDNASCKLSADGIEMPPSIAANVNAVLGGPMVAHLAKIGSSIDLRNLVVFATRGDFITTFLIKDAGAFASAMSEDAHSVTDKDGFTVYAGRMVVITRDRQGWMAEGSVEDVIAEVSGMIDSASDSPFTTHNGLLQYLSASDAMGAVINMAAFGLPDDNVWLAGNLHLDKMAAMLDLQFMHSDGELIPVPALQTIDTDFLRYVPGDFNFAAAAGVADGPQLSAILSVVAQRLSFRQRSMLESVIPFIAKVDGTVAVAARIDDDAADTAGMTPPAMLAMARMKQADVDASLASLVEMARGMGARVEQLGEGSYKAEAPGMEVYLRNVDGQLGIATVPFEDTRDNSLNTRFLSRLAALSMDMPAGFKGMFDRPAILTANVQQQQIQVKFEFPESDGPFLKTYMESARNL